LIINLIANEIFSTISNHPLLQYQEVEEALATPRGSINFNRYINQSLSRSNFHMIECDYEPFVFDNKVNRVIKYCCRLLLNKTTLSENIRILQEVINHLDEVTDTVVTLRDAESIVFNHFYEDYANVIDSCKLILGQQLYSGTPYDLSQWCLLLPMEYIFEDFVAGFLETHFSKDWTVEYQKSDLYLSDQPQVFNLQQDIFLTNRSSGRKAIVDAKYKIRDPNFKSDAKKGVSQSDLYQMVSYAYKRGCNEVVLIYPNVSEEIKEPDVFEINSGFESSNSIIVKAIEVPFWSIKDITSLESRLIDVLDEL
jgi:5-methylcytosine-specific restriction enzyme subunit McrC